MIFYDCSTAPSPRRARMFIAEKGLSPDVREINIGKNEQLSPEFLAVNPGATVPVLVTDDGVTLTENLGIAAYLDAAFVDPPLMGSTPSERGEVLMWNAIAEQQCGLAIAEVLRNTHPAMKGRALPGPVPYEQIPELAERGMKRLGAFFAMFERHMTGREWVAGSEFGLADITAFVLIDFARVIRQRIPEGNTATRAWFDRVAARPSARL